MKSYFSDLKFGLVITLFFVLKHIDEKGIDARSLTEAAVLIKAFPIS